MASLLTAASAGMVASPLLPRSFFVVLLLSADMIKASSCPSGTFEYETGRCFYIQNFTIGQPNPLNRAAAEDQCKLLTTDVNQWHLPKLDSEGKDQLLIDLIRNATNRVDWVIWIGLMRVEGNPEIWQDKSKWYWTVDNTTLNSSFPSTSPPWKENEPDNAQYEASKVASDLERCVVAEMNSSLKKHEWSDIPCDKAPPGDRHINDYMLVCESLPLETTSSTAVSSSLVETTSAAASTVSSTTTSTFTSMATSMATFTTTSATTVSTTHTTTVDSTTGTTTSTAVSSSMLKNKTKSITHLFLTTRMPPKSEHEIWPWVLLGLCILVFVISLLVLVMVLMNVRKASRPSKSVRQASTGSRRSPKTATVTVTTITTAPRGSSISIVSDMPTRKEKPSEKKTSVKIPNVPQVKQSVVSKTKSIRIVSKTKTKSVACKVKTPLKIRSKVTVKKAK